MADRNQYESLTGETTDSPILMRRRTNPNVSAPASSSASTSASATATAATAPAPVPANANAPSADSSLIDPVKDLEPFLEVPKIKELVELYINKYCGLLLKHNQRKLALNKLNDNKSSNTFPNSIKVSSKILIPNEFKHNDEFKSILKADEDALFATQKGTLDRLIRLETLKLSAVEAQALAILDDLMTLLIGVNVTEFGYHGDVCAALVNYVKNAGSRKCNNQLLEKKLTAVNKTTMATKVNEMEVDQLDENANSKLVKDLVKLAINPLNNRIKKLEKDKITVKGNANNNSKTKQNHNKNNSNAGKKSQASTSTAKKKKNESRKESTQATNANGMNGENGRKRNVRRTSINISSASKKKK